MNYDENEIKMIVDEVETLSDNVKNIHSKLTDRIDMLETAFKRPGRELSGQTSFFGDNDVSEFSRAIKSIYGQKDNVLSDKEIPNISRSEFESYKKSFNRYLKGGKEILQDYEQKDLSIGIGPGGGITVTPQMSTRILETIGLANPIRQLATVETTTTSALEFLCDDEADTNSEAGSSWEGENYGETVAPTKTATPKLKKLKISVHTLFARPLATQNLLEDSGIDIEQWLIRKVSRKFSRDEGAAFVSGNGIGKPRGFLTYDNGTTFGTIEQVATGAADALTADFFIRMFHALKEEYRANATWIMANTSIQAAKLLKDGHGRYLFIDSLVANQPSTLLGLPVRSAAAMPEVAAGALAVALADWREAYTIVDRLGITVVRDALTVKPFVEFYTRKRCGADVTNFEAIKLGKISAA